MMVIAFFLGSLETE